ncbi:MAG: QacE family quaternary ammonium compound efflux SMR transporter [Planctomycetota bacterium]|nr:MAG: QacE family quaternary ammonium compound efflux SMR transporter [Planctomycetota bacterium]
MRHWFYLFLAIFFEIAGTTSMKLSEGFSRFFPSVCIFIFYGICFYFLTLALRGIDISTAYAIWSGLGTALIVGIGFFYFRETISWSQLFFISLILVGVVGLHLSRGSLE